MEQGPAKGPIASAAESSGRSCDQIRGLMHLSRSTRLAAQRVRTPVLMQPGPVPSTLPFHSAGLLGWLSKAPGVLIFTAQIFNHQELHQILDLMCSRAGGQFSGRLCECLGCCQAGSQFSERLDECLGSCRAGSQFSGRLCECLGCCRAGSSGRGFDSGAGSGSGGDGEAGTEEVGTPRAGACAPKGKCKRSNLGQAQVKVCAAQLTSHIPRCTAHAV